MRQRVAITTLVVVLTIIVTWLGLRAVSVAAWVALADGPFGAESFASPAPEVAASSQLSVGNGAILEVYDMNPTNTPVLALRARDGKLAWVQRLVVVKRFSSGISKAMWVKDARLEKTERYLGVPTVWFRCDWEFGGHERGLIRFNSDGSIKDVYIAR